MNSRATSFEFIEQSHEYRIDGAIIPGVTTVIKEVVGSGFEFMKDAEWYMQRGRAVHLAAKLIAQGKEITNIDPRIEGRIEALRKFWREVEITNADRIEEPLFSATYRFAGTPDVLADWEGCRCIFDYKSTVDEHRLPLQLGGYAILANEDRVMYGVGVALRDDGTYKLTKRMKLDGAKRDFLNLRGTYSIKCRMKLIDQQKERHES